MKHADCSPWSIQMATEMRALERARWLLRSLGVAGVVIAATVGGTWWTDSARTAPGWTTETASATDLHP